MIKITVLLENTALPGSKFEAKHGLSLYVETGKHKLLFDTGPDDAFLRNAMQLQVDLSEVEAVIISHGHYDHTGGLRAFFEVNHHAPVFLLEGAQHPFYSLSMGLPYRYIGMDAALLEMFKDRFHFFHRRLSPIEGVLLSEVTSFGTFKPTNSVLFIEQNGLKVLDAFSHELVMSIEDDQQLTVFTGCSHQGVINMVMTVQQQFPKLPIRGLVGGFHLSNTRKNILTEPEEVVIDLAHQLNQLHIPFIFTGHCTGVVGFDLLHTVLKNNLFAMHTGLKFEI
ncbi:MAG: MBL fold metallo-hydrolase [Microbacter sp.]